MTHCRHLKMLSAQAQKAQRRKPCRAYLIKTVMVLVLGAALTSCSRGVSGIQTHPLGQQNPISYSFPLPVQEVRTKALEAFAIQHQIKAPIFRAAASAVRLEPILSVECATNAVFSEALFRDPANQNDLYLHAFHSPICLSSVYRGRKGGLPFIAAFHVHLASAGSNTLVTVTASDTEVVNGRKFGFGPCGPGFGWNCQKVNPTTVEEYILLRYLGWCLGTTNMSEPILPTR